MDIFKLIKTPHWQPLRWKDAHLGKVAPTMYKHLQLLDRCGQRQENHPQFEGPNAPYKVSDESYLGEREAAFHPLSLH